MSHGIRNLKDRCTATRQRFGAAVIVALFVVAGAACNNSAAHGGDDGGLTKVTLRLPYLALGYDSPFYLAKERGYYRKQGLDVTIAQGKGSPVTAQTVASGSDDFGYVDLATAALTVGKGASIKAVAGLQQIGSASFVYRPPVELHSMADMKGHKILGTGGNNDLLFRALLQKSHMTVQDVGGVTVVEASQAKSAFLNTPGAIYLSNIAADAAALQATHPEVKVTPFSEFGLNLLGYGIVASQEMIDKNPSVVKKFVTASVQGWQAAQDDPGAAADAILKPYPSLGKGVTLAQTKAVLSLAHTSRTKGKPLGYMANEDWVDTLATLKQFSGLESDEPAQHYYTNEFVSGR